MTRARNRRGSTRAWRKLRQQYAPVVALGLLTCPRCGQLIHPGQEWHLGHKIAKSQGGRDTADNIAPEHALCNLRGSAAPIPDQPATFAGFADHHNGRRP